MFVVGVQAGQVRVVNTLLRVVPSVHTPPLHPTGPHSCGCFCSRLFPLQEGPGPPTFCQVQVVPPPQLEALHTPV